jgi:hypothetical protein
MPTVLSVVVIAVDGEFELAEAADAEVDIAQSAPSRVIRTDQRLGVGGRSIAHTIGACHRAGDHALQVFDVQVARRMAAGADPVLNDVGVAVDDHRAISRQDAAAHRLAAACTICSTYESVSSRFTRAADIPGSNRHTWLNVRFRVLARRCTHAEDLGFVRSGKHNTAADCDRLTAQSRVKQLLDRGVEAIQVSMEDGGSGCHPNRSPA